MNAASSVDDLDASDDPTTSEGQDHLTFSIAGSWFALPARLVREVVHLPELTPLPEASYDVAGMLNLRGEILPVVDLAVRLGLAPEPYDLDTGLVVVERDDASVALIVDHVQEVVPIPDEARREPASLEQVSAERTRFAEAMVDLDERILVVLDPDRLFAEDEQTQVPEAQEPGEETAVGLRAVAERSRWAPLDEEAKAKLRQRARDLREPHLELSDVRGEEALAVVRIGEELYGIELAEIEGFTEVGEVTPVPSTPDHVLGLANHRGDVLTVVDVRSVLRGSSEGRLDAETSVVVEIDEGLVGISVEEILGIEEIDRGERREAMDHGPDVEEYVQDSVPYGERLLAILDVDTLLRSPEVVVDVELHAGGRGGPS